MPKDDAHPGRGLPLTLRLLLVMAAGALVVSLVVAFLSVEQLREARNDARAERIERLGQDIARRAGPMLERSDDMRLAVLAATAAELGPCRVVLLDLEGRVRLDSELMLGGRKLALLTEQGAFHRRLSDTHEEYLAPVRSMSGRAGEVRLTYDTPIGSAADFPFALFGVAFAASLVLIGLACAFCQHLARRIREAALAVQRLARGERWGFRPSRAPELRALQEALASMGSVVEQGMIGTERALIDMACRLVDTIEHHSSVTPGHGVRTQRYAALLGRRLGLIDGDLRELELAARLHDLGKACVRASILDKTGALDREERASLREHPGHGGTFLEAQPTLRTVARYVRHHHEKYDGTGYPDGLRGERIPLASRVIAIADAYDQITSRSIYGEPLDWRQALDKLREDRGTHFDPWLLDLFEEEIRREPMPARPLRPLVISTEGVLPYKAAEELADGESADEDVAGDEDLALLGDDLEVVADETFREVEP
jgi:HD-GYP domain-containing protein (c-di-GMP phosphodiesterase class II)